MIGSHAPLRRPARAVALAIAAAAAALIAAPGANALGTSAGAAAVRSSGNAADLGSGDSSTSFTLALPAGAQCAGDSANGGYFVQSYIVPASVDPATLTFDANGPVPNGPAPIGLGATLRQPMYTPTGQPYTNQVTAPAAPAPGPGPIINIPDFSYKFYEPGNIPAGAYNVGIACTKGTPGPDQMKEFWNVQMTFTTNAGGGPAQVDWVAAASQVTTTLAPGVTTTTAPGGSTTTTRASTTTIRASTSTTAAGGSSTTSAGGTTNASVAGTTVASNPLARTGGSSLSLVAWSVLLLVLGRMVVLVVRTPEVRTGARR